MFSEIKKIKHYIMATDSIHHSSLKHVTSDIPVNVNTSNPDISLLYESSVHNDLAFQVQIKRLSKMHEYQVGKDNGVDGVENLKEEFLDSSNVTSSINWRPTDDYAAKEATKKQLMQSMDIESAIQDMSERCSSSIPFEGSSGSQLLSTPHRKPIQTSGGILTSTVIDECDTPSLTPLVFQGSRGHTRSVQRATVVIVDNDTDSSEDEPAKIARRKCIRKKKYLNSLMTSKGFTVSDSEGMETSDVGSGSSIATSSVSDEEQQTSSSEDEGTSSSSSGGDDDDEVITESSDESDTSDVGENPYDVAAIGFGEVDWGSDEEDSATDKEKQDIEKESTPIKKEK
eukprot:Tbor_TRINITY_DN4770_c0_g1::TRINITY_DN4770_c0_g1_i2::g.17212::m.17212